MGKILKKEEDKNLNELMNKWKPLIYYLERNWKEPDKVLDTLIQLEDVVQIWNSKEVNQPSDRSGTLN